MGGGGGGGGGGGRGGGGVKNTKSLILRLICHLEHYKSINRQNKWSHKQNSTKNAFCKA